MDFSAGEWPNARGVLRDLTRNAHVRYFRWRTLAGAGAAFL